MGLVATHLQPRKLDGASAGPGPVSAVPSLTSLVIDPVASRCADGIAVIQNITKEDTTNKAGSGGDSLRLPVQATYAPGSGDAAWRAFYFKTHRQLF